MQRCPLSVMDYLFVFLFGLVAGSFINVVIYRLPRSRGLTGRSACPGCAWSIVWYDLIPLMSFLLLRGRCRACRQPISWQYFVVELYSGLAALASFEWLGRSGLADAAFGFFLLMIFLILLVIDLKHFILPNSVIGAGVFGAVLYVFFGPGNFYPLTYQNILTALGLFIFFFLFWVVSRGTWLGLGDAKLAAMIGLVFGPLGGIAIIYLAIILGAIVGIALMAFKRAGPKTRLPLGSFMCLTASLYLFFGYAIIQRVDFVNLILRIGK